MTSAADGTIQTWDWNTGRNISTLAAHTNAVRGFFLTDQHIVSGGMDGCVWIRNRTEETVSRGLREEAGAVWHFVSNTDTIALALRVGEGMHLVEIWDASAL
jgi:WD40 repeat protein